MLWVLLFQRVSLIILKSRSLTKALQNMQEREKKHFNSNMRLPYHLFVSKLNKPIFKKTKSQPYLIKILTTLILDTSTSKSIVAFAEGKHLLFVENLPHGSPTSSFLMKIIEKGFNQLNIKASELKALVVAQGPGSYTGVRVAAAAAKGLAFPHSIPIIGFCSLEGFISEKEGPFASLIDAGVGGCYILLQKREGETLSVLSPPTLIPYESLEVGLADYPERVGPHTGYPNPLHIAALGEQRLQQGLFSNDLSLLYLRTPEYKKSPQPLIRRPPLKKYER